MRFLLPLALLVCALTVCVPAQDRRPGGGMGLERKARVQGAEQLARRVLARRDYQVDFPGQHQTSDDAGRGAVQPPPRPRPRRPREYRRGRGDESDGATLTNADSPVFLVLVAIGVVALIVILILSVRAQDRDVTVRSSAAKDRKKPKPRPEWGRGPLDRAAELAKHGRYAEAIRLLLGGSFEGLHHGQDVTIDRCLTGREILAAVQLADPHRRALQNIVGAVERSLFGGRDASPQDYTACVESYQSLLESAGATA